MDHLESFEDLISAIKVEGVSEDYFYASSSSIHLLERLRIGLSRYHHDLLHPGPTSRTRFSVSSLMRHVLKTWGVRLVHSPRSLQSHSEAPGSDSSLTRGIVHTMDSMRCSCSAPSSEVSQCSIRWLLMHPAKGTSTAVRHIENLVIYGVYGNQNLHCRFPFKLRKIGNLKFPRSPGYLLNHTPSNQNTKVWTINKYMESKWEQEWSLFRIHVWA